MKPKHCITCEADGIKPRKRAKHYIKVHEAELGFCDEHYNEYLMLEEFSIDLIEENYGDCCTED